MDLDQDPERDLKVMMISGIIQRMDPEIDTEIMRMKEKEKNRLKGDGHVGFSMSCKCAL